ncbi:MAG: class I SAM-dependent methyltransferase [Acidimicrobiia bacterium]|nr:class I SAM-dependent methyltransferase [Acidimicrobiia bacterium]
MPDPLGDFDPTTTYDEAVLEYESASGDFWRHLSDHTVELLALQRGERVLDLPCGTGHVALGAAERVGPDGRVVALDVSERMTQLVSHKAAQLQLTNVDVGVADMTRLGRPDPPFDAVACVLGIFFAPDMPAALRSLAAQARPGGRIAVAVFGEEFFEPMRTTFVDAVRAVAPDLQVVEPWARVRTEQQLRELFDAADLTADVETCVDEVPLTSADDWWRIVMGSGLRATVGHLDPATAAGVRDRCAEEVERHGLTALRVTSRYGVAAAA